MFRGVLSHPLTSLTAPAGSPIVALIPPLIDTPPAYSRVVSLAYACPVEQHVLTLMPACWRTTLAADVALNGTSLTLLEDLGASPQETPAGALAAGDWVCVQLDDGTFWLAVSTAKSSLTLTIDDGLPFTASAGRSVWVFGVPDDHGLLANNDPRHRRPRSRHGNRFLATLGLNRWEDAAGGVCQTFRTADPIMLHVDNTGTAGMVEQFVGAYTLN